MRKLIGACVEVRICERCVFERQRNSLGGGCCNGFESLSERWGVRKCLTRPGPLIEQTTQLVAVRRTLADSRAGGLRARDAVWVVVHVGAPGVEVVPGHAVRTTSPGRRTERELSVRPGESSCVALGGQPSAVISLRGGTPPTG